MKQVLFIFTLLFASQANADMFETFGPDIVHPTNNNKASIQERIKNLRSGIEANRASIDAANKAKAANLKDYHTKRQEFAQTDEGKADLAARQAKAEKQRKYVNATSGKARAENSEKAQSNINAHNTWKTENADELEMQSEMRKMEIEESRTLGYE